MDRYDELFRLYSSFDTDTLRALQDFVDLFPPVDSRVVLEWWEDVGEELESAKEAVREAFGARGETYAAVAARATREQAFTGLDLHAKHGRGVNVLVLDVDETLRSAGRTDNEIPRETLNLLTEFHEAGLPIVVCTGQTVENVKGFLVQGLGNELVHSGSLAVVYEAGTGVFSPGHGADTKRLLYEDLDDEVRGLFGDLRSRVLADAPAALRRESHLQGNEFNVTVKPNYETGSDRARDVVERALLHQLDVLGASVAERADVSADRAGDWARAFYGARDPEIRAVLEARDALPAADEDAVPEPVAARFDRVEVAYYEADAAELGSHELNKVVGVEAAFDVLDVAEPFALVMGDSKSDLRVMRWLDEADAGIAAAPDHASREVLDHVIRTDELVFDRGRAGDVLRTVYALNRLAALA